MQLRDFAEQVLFARTLDEKLACPRDITDERPGDSIPAPKDPGRPPELHFKPGGPAKTSFPGLQDLEQPVQRGRLLHFFANHELLATELMALVLLRFPNAPAAFRRGVLQTLQQEQQHTRWYLNRMKDCGIAFGELPVSGYFWRSISTMESPLDYVAGLSLTFEQANLDFTRFFSGEFQKIGDSQTSRLLEQIYQDEIGHVAYGLKWFRKWKDPSLRDWEAYCNQLKFPMSAQRAKGPLFNIQGRLAAGLDREFIDELNVFAQSKGRTPAIFLFNPFAEGRIARGKSFTPNQHQQLLQKDLENLPQFLCRQDDVVLVGERPAPAFLGKLKEEGWVVPEFVQLSGGGVESLSCRKVGRLTPWAWGPDSLETLGPLFGRVTIGSKNPGDYFNSNIAKLYSKEWSAELLRRLLRHWSQNGNQGSAVEASHAECSWVCTELEAGSMASTLEQAVTAINSIRARGHQKIVIKEAIGLAGHNAIRLLEPELLEPQRRWISAALENGRRVVVEPWLERQLDFSVQLEMTSTGLRLLGYTGLLNDAKGQFRGNWAWKASRHSLLLGFERLFPSLPDIANRIRCLYSDIFSMLEEELKSTLYHGPLGIDAFVYLTPAGESRLKPIVEINPRYTMGRLNLELMKNVAPGKVGSFQLVTLKQIQNQGFATFAAWAGAQSAQSSLRFEGQPVPKITEGFMCLNDPDRAQACLAIFRVGSHGPSQVL